MYLEKGIEEFGEDHKPSPFTIECPYCGGLAMDVYGRIQKIPGGVYVPLPEGYSYFANREDHRCGVPTFGVIAENEILGNSASMWIADIFDRLRSQEMEMCQEAILKEQERMEEIEKTGVIFAKRAGISLDRAIAMLIDAMQDFGDAAKKVAELLPEPEPGEPVEIPTARD